MTAGLEDQDAPPRRTNLEDGTVVQFLRRNYFLVLLRDRQVVACMPEKLLPVGAQFKTLRPGEFVRVTVRLRPPPRNGPDREGEAREPVLTREGEPLGEPR